ncbi:MAG TPA: prepilin-type N-terminal cleavage/methylation domain-containing protein [Dissulfurispiraceae bacterium]|nr:prepilin-type N-terminal cleavage/methylation domain-containing protein [Dissulfurispiraceae bacterium]
MDENGVSLVELMIVVAILAILLTISSISLLRARDNANLRSAALEVEGDITETRTRALARNRLHRMTFTINSPNYVIEECTVASQTPCAAYAVVQAKDLRNFGDAGTFVVNANFSATPFLLFQMRGTADPGTVVIQNNRGSQATITTNFRARTYVTYVY